MRNHILTLVTLVSIFGTLGAQDKLSSNTRDSIAAMKAATGEVPFNAISTDQIYVKKQIDLGGIVELIDANTKSIEGVSSTEDGVLTRPHAVSGIQFNYGQSPAADPALDPGAVDYTTDLPDYLKNGVFRIKQGDETVFSCLVGDLVNGGDTNLNERFTEVYPIGLGNKHKLRMEIKFPPTGVTPAFKHYVFVNLRTQSLNA